MWDYKQMIVKTDGDPTQWKVDKTPFLDVLNAAGKQGWEVVGIAPVMAKVAFGSQPGGNRLFFLMKRPA